MIFGACGLLLVDSSSSPAQVSSEPPAQASSPTFPDPAAPSTLVEAIETPAAVGGAEDEVDALEAQAEAIRERG
ncbi:MAG: hypothetical protein ABGY42_03995, partial [bacterium]